MARQRLTAALQTVHAELARHPTLSADERALLQTTLHDLQAALDQPGAAPHDVVHRLENATLSFEQRHPALTALLGELAVIARGAGL
jgi:hypothetical protein